MTRFFSIEIKWPLHALIISMNEMIIVPFSALSKTGRTVRCPKHNCTMHKVDNCKKDKNESFERTAGIFGKSSKQSCSRISNGMVGRPAPVKN